MVVGGGMRIDGMINNAKDAVLTITCNECGRVAAYDESYNMTVFEFMCKVPQMHECGTPDQYYREVS